MKASLGVSMAKRFQSKKLDAIKADKEVKELIKMVFGNDSTKIENRLSDPGDLLDYSHIVSLITALAEKQSGNPSS